MRNEQNLNFAPAGYDRWEAAPPWWTICRKELRDLWLGGRALYLTLAYLILMGGYAYLMAKDSVLSMIPAQEMVYETLKAALVAGEIVGLIIAADSLSGERDRATLEGLLLTPTSRRQIVVGKFLAAVSPFPVSLFITVPYLKVLSQGNEVFGQAVVSGIVVGTIMIPAWTAMGMLVSFWSNNNKTSFFMSLCLYLVFLLPTTLPGHAQAGFMGHLVQWVNPLAAPRVFLGSFLVNNKKLPDLVEGIGPLWSWLAAPVVFAVLVFAVLFLYASPGLRLEAGRARKLRSRAAVGLAVIVCLMGFLTLTPVMAQEAERGDKLASATLPTASTAAEQLPLQISIDMAYTTVKAGDPIFYNTVVTNNGTVASPPLCVAMNIINLSAEGEIVDPEDWSPQRTQYLKTLEPGQSATLSWRVNAILDGDYLVYMVVIPEPAGKDATSQPIASSGIHLTVMPFTRLNPGGVLPYAIGGPLVLGLIIYLVYRQRHRRIDEGDASAES
ncbi:MAG: ABC transporter permease [candidate division KSB1 bacterium]|nr:ABC transporter permease [candidate division KSB1 bacterium]MDZ7300676.1 ABC transporter permease [candidate division KSB1 bacterium]MDZ7309812.1 ABC transporter permease [candidate division KSB1 bacterium]